MFCITTVENTTNSLQKILPTSYFGYFGHVWPLLSKRTWWWTQFLTYFLRYCKDIANLLLWVLWECLTMSNNIIVSPCRKLWSPKYWRKLEGNFDVYPCAKNQPLEILQRQYKLAILQTLGMLDHPVQNHSINL